MGSGAENAIQQAEFAACWNMTGVASLLGEEDMGGLLTKPKASSLEGKAKKAKTKGPKTGDVPPLPYLASGSTAVFGQEDYDAVYDYTDKEYKIMNSYFRNPDGYEPAEAAGIQARADRVSAALAKLPPQPGLTYRASNLSEDVLKNYEEGNVVTERAFTSTSSDPQITTKKPFAGNTVMTITGESGRDISGFSRYPSEKEVLYDKGTKFKVTGRSWDPERKTWFIQFEEAES